MILFVLLNESYSYKFYQTLIPAGRLRIVLFIAVLSAEGCKELLLIQELN
jgi:hypothetical protein